MPLFFAPKHPVPVWTNHSEKAGYRQSTKNLNIWVITD
ncbi:hypothetical protein J542_2062 [Acinetobacter baumannii 299505]|nr:hypothetical protein J542_2062 [Acinetobacter baumannii 299505]